MLWLLIVPAAVVGFCAGLWCILKVAEWWYLDANGNLRHWR
jgi:hypothetical protein